MKKIVVLLLLIPIMGLAQNGGGLSPILALVIFTGAIPHNHTSLSRISFPGEWDGTAVYCNDTITGNFAVKRGVLETEKLSTRLLDSKLTLLHLKRVNEELYLERLNGYDGLIHRRLFENFGVTVYDNNWYTFNNKDVKRGSLLFLYEGKFYALRNNIFKHTDENIRNVMAQIALPEEEREAILQQCMKLIKA